MSSSWFNLERFAIKLTTKQSLVVAWSTDHATEAPESSRSVWWPGQETGPQRVISRRLSVVALIVILLTAGCQQDMAEQPSYGPLRPSDFFADGRSARPPVPGTVARGRLNEDDAFYTGRVAGDSKPAQNIAAGPGIQADANLHRENFVHDFPFPMTEDVLKRGQQRFGIYCSMCHGVDGSGNGKIVERGFTRPPSYLTDLSRGYLRRGEKVSLRDVPVGYLFDVITNGYGAMATYKEQIGPRDRWAIVGYIRVLQAASEAGDRVAEGRHP